MGSEAVEMYECQYPDFAGCAVVTSENLIVCRKYMEMFGNDGASYLLFALKWAREKHALRCTYHFSTLEIISKNVFKVK